MRTQPHSFSPLDSFWHSVEQFTSRLSAERPSLAISEPEIRQVRPQGGQIWWYAYEPATGEMTYLESEADIDSWRDQYFRNQR